MKHGIVLALIAALYFAVPFFVVAQSPGSDGTVGTPGGGGATGQPGGGGTSGVPGDFGTVGGSGFGGTVGSPSPCNPARQFCNPIQSRDFTELIGRLAGLLARIGVVVVAVVLVYAGFLFVSAQGNEEKLALAKRAFFWAVVGAALVLGAFIIASALANFAGKL